MFGFDGYEVSCFGRVRSIARSYVRPHPRNREMIQTRKVPPCIIKLGKNRKGYVTLNSRRHGSKMIHRAVAEAFIANGAIPKGLVVCHKDGSRDNNNVANLYIGTYKDNLNDADRHGTRGLRPNRKLSWGDVFGIRSSSSSVRELAKLYNVSTGCIHMVRNHQSWKVQ